MRRAARIAIGTFALVLPSVPVAAEDMWHPNYMWGAEIESPSVRVRMQRHFTYMYNGVPPAYRDAKPPFPSNPDRSAQGRDLYRTSCAECHRMDGSGGGDAALGLAPSPALLAHMIRRPGAADEYLLWCIADGGAQFGTDMPAFKDSLPRDAIWKIIAFMRAGFPPDP